MVDSYWCCQLCFSSCAVIRSDYTVFSTLVVKRGWCNSNSISSNPIKSYLNKYFSVTFECSLLQSRHCLSSWSSIETNFTSICKNFAARAPSTFEENCVLFFHTKECNFSFVSIRFERSTNVEFRVVTSD